MRCSKFKLLRLDVCLFVCGFAAMQVVCAASVIAATANQNSQNSETAEFKIETEVFANGATSPVSKNQTLFQNNLVFDFRFQDLVNSAIIDVAIFDSRDRSFVLLDMKRKFRLKIDNLQLLHILDGMKNELQKSEKMAHLLFAENKEEFDINSNTITVSNDSVIYTARGNRPENDLVLVAYMQFLDNYTMLGAMDPARMPPFARIRLNQAIKKYGLIPSEVSLTVKKPEDSQNELTASSKHKIVFNLSKDDRDRIANSRLKLIQFKKVSLAEYMDLAVEDSSAVANVSGSGEATK